jgi:hypothetical protein
MRDAADHDWNAAATILLSEKFHTIHARHDEVERDDVRPVPLGELECLETISRRGDDFNVGAPAEHSGYDLPHKG